MNGMNYLARNATHTLKVSTMTQFWNTYLQPRMDFASVVTFQPYATITNKYQSFFDKYWSFCGGPPAGILTPPQRFLFNDLMMLFKWRLNLIEALPYEEYFHERIDTGGRSQNLGIIVTKRYNTLPRKYSYCVRVVCAWLGLSEELRLETDLLKFKSGVKREIVAHFPRGYRDVVFDESKQITIGGSQLQRQLE